MKTQNLASNHTNVTTNYIQANKYSVIMKSIVIIFAIILIISFVSSEKTYIHLWNNQYTKSVTKEKQIRWWCRSWNLNEEECAIWTKKIIKFKDIDLDPTKSVPPIVFNKNDNKLFLIFQK